MDKARIFKPYSTNNVKEMDELGKIVEVIKNFGTNIPAYIKSFNDFLFYFNIEKLRYLLAVCTTISKD